MNLKDNPKIQELMEVIVNLEHHSEALAFFEDLCTTKELLDFSERYQVAKLLYEKNTYETIAAQTGMSTATIARVNRSLVYGENGYATMIERMKAKKDASDADE